MPYGFRYPHEKGSMVDFGSVALTFALKMAPSQIPGPVALWNAVTVAPFRATPCGEYPLVLSPSPESNVFWLSVMS
jgi:hypothetical protein